MIEPSPKKELRAEVSLPLKEDTMETDNGHASVLDEAERVLLENRVQRLLPPSTVTKLATSLARHPVSKYHKLEFSSYGEGHATAKAFFSDARPHSKCEVHAVLGAAYFLIDTTSYVAVLTTLHEGESAITQDIQVSVLAPIPQGSEVKINAKIAKTKPITGLIFLDVEVTFGSKLMATAKVIKSIFEPDLPVKEEKEKKLDNNTNNIPGLL